MKIIKCPHCEVRGYVGIYMEHHMLRCGNKQLQFGQTLKIIISNLRKAFR